jgi:two-component sensor histidine kinase
MVVGNSRGDTEHRRELLLSADLGSPRRAREFVSAAAKCWGRPEISLEAGLCASELVTNVLVHTKCSRCQVVVRYTNGHLYVEVHDDSTEAPNKTPTAADADHGRGLQIVDALAATWGVDRSSGHGKSVWLRMDSP